MRQLFMLCVTWTALAMLCSPQTVGAVARPKELRPLPGAKHVKYGNEYEGTISYELTEPYPAAHAIDLLRPRFKRDGWRELAEDSQSGDTELIFARLGSIRGRAIQGRSHKGRAPVGRPVERRHRPNPLVHA